MNAQLVRDGRDDLPLAHEPQELVLQLRRVDARGRPLHRQPRLAQPVVSGILMNAGGPRRRADGPASIKKSEELFLLLVGVSLLRHCDTSSVGVATNAGIQAKDGWVYCAAVIDAFSRRIVGWSISDRITAEIVVDALEMARWRRRPEPGTVVHADRGAQYTSWLLGHRLRQAGLLGSMGGVASSGDNALIESFWTTIQRELLDRTNWDSRTQLASSMFEWIEAFYNPTRRHTALGNLSPADYETLHTPAATAA